MRIPCKRLVERGISRRSTEPEHLAELREPALLLVLYAHHELKPGKSVAYEWPATCRPESVLCAIASSSNLAELPLIGASMDTEASVGHGKTASVCGVHEHCFAHCFCLRRMWHCKTYLWHFVVWHICLDGLGDWKKPMHTSSTQP